MAVVQDSGFLHMLANAILEDNPNDAAAKEILSKPKYRVNDKYFNTKEEMDSFLNSPEGAKLRVF